MRRAAAALALVALAGCGGSDEPKMTIQTEARPAPAPRVEQNARAGDVKVIRGWIGAMNRHDYAAAASYFAPGAIVDQGRPLVLTNRKAAKIWNSGLPCDADLASVRQVGGLPIARFTLRRGPGGPCRGEAMVVFTISRAKIVRWEQLPQRQEPSPDESAA